MWLCRCTGPPSFRVRCDIVFNWPSSSCMHTCPIQQHLPSFPSRSIVSKSRSISAPPNRKLLPLLPFPSSFHIGPSDRTHGRQLLLIPSRKPIILSPSLAPSSGCWWPTAASQYGAKANESVARSPRMVETLIGLEEAAERFGDVSRK